MSKRIELGLFDQFISKKLLKKRTLGAPFKYYYEEARESTHTRLLDILYFPKSKLDKTIGNIYEKCMPGVQYFFWNEQVMWAREYGYTLGEKFFHTFQHAQNIQLHAMAQTIHPWGWLQNHRRDNFFRKLSAFFPGVQLPDWAQESRRVPDVDINSIMTPILAMDMVYKESTPKCHINPPLYTALQNIFNQQNNIGYAAQRLFFNESIRGDYYNRGVLNQTDKEKMDSWYANSQGDSQKSRIDGMNAVERSDYERNKERWDKNLEKHFPELKGRKHNPVLHKYDEPHFERNMFDIRGAIFTSKWMDALYRSVFSDSDVHSIHDFFLNGNTQAFFDMEEETLVGNNLYSRFVKELNFPDFAKIDRFTTYTPEQQFYDLLDKNWGINFSTVDSYRGTYLQMMKYNTDSPASSLVLEEVYNPLFRQLLKEKFNSDIGQTDSFCLRALNDKKTSLEELNQIAKSARQNVMLCSSEVLKRMVDSQVRTVVRTFQWSGK